MDSSELYHVKQQFILGMLQILYFSLKNIICILGAYKTLVQTPLPDSSSSDYIPRMLYNARAYIALNEPKGALELIPEDSENIALKAVRSLARYVDAADSTKAEAALEELRDLSVEIEGEDVDEGERDKALVRVLAATAFARAGEVEEALETLGSDTEDLEACVAFIIPGIIISFSTWQCGSDRSNIPFHKPRRFSQETIRSFKTLGGG
jgi:coatomer subunit epsilon